MILLIYFLAILSPKPINSFSTRFCSFSDSSLRRRDTSLFNHNRPLDTTVDALLAELVEEERDETAISRYINDLEASYIPAADDNDARFEPLLGLYEVSYIKTTSQTTGTADNNNPVGGKWTKRRGLGAILKTKRAFQHILTANSTGRGESLLTVDDGQRRHVVVAEAINVISLEALGGLCRCSVILRGDAIALNITERSINKNVTTTQPLLSTVAVRAIFDAPRIVFGKTGRWFNFNIGPKSSVLLDASYVDDRIRIGVGGTSGTRFIFKRCQETDDEATEFRGLLAKKPMKKKKVLSILTALGTFGLYAAISRGFRVLGVTFAICNAVAGFLVAFSSGGIERNEDSHTMAEKESEVAKL